MANPHETVNFRTPKKQKKKEEENNSKINEK